MNYGQAQRFILIIYKPLRVGFNVGSKYIEWREENEWRAKAKDNGAPPCDRPSWITKLLENKANRGADLHNTSYSKCKQHAESYTTRIRA